jgi:hypothetical protein
MRHFGYLAIVLLAAATPVGGAAFANVCQADTLMCATTMPVGGYCECRVRGQTEGGTVLSNAEARQSRRPLNATAGGCGAEPNAPGCRSLAGVPSP